MGNVTIREPYWKHNAFGVAKDVFSDGEALVKCSYKNKNGQKLFPETYKITKEKASIFGTMMRKGKELYIIPVNAFEIVEKGE